tara:strand:+ start:316 stop:435 length:120 start_codon:yes stop_codon:yes gene_type:complete
MITFNKKIEINLKSVCDGSYEHFLAANNLYFSRHIPISQ